MRYFSLRNFNSGKTESCQDAKDKLVSAFSWELVSEYTSNYYRPYMNIEHSAFPTELFHFSLHLSVTGWITDSNVGREFRDPLAHAPILWIRELNLREFSRPVSPRRSPISTLLHSLFHLKRLLPVAKWLPPFLSLHSRASFLISIVNVLWKHACSAQSNGFAKQQLPLNHFPLKEQRRLLGSPPKSLGIFNPVGYPEKIWSQHNMATKAGKSGEGVTS